MSFAPLLKEADALFEAAVTQPLVVFEPLALRRLGQVVGFDGMVWGEGHLEGHPAAVVIDQAALIDRPAALVQGYAAIAQEDPISRAFLGDPRRPVVESITRPRHHELSAAERDFLLGCDVGHLVLCGRPREDATLRWLAAYRQPGDPTFTPDEVRLLWGLLPLWNQAWELCRARQGVPAAWAPPDAAAAVDDADRVPARALTPRQTAVLQELSQGLRYAEIAARLGLSVDTVRAHVRDIYARLGVRNRTEALLVAKVGGWTHGRR